MVRHDHRSGRRWRGTAGRRTGGRRDPYITVPPVAQSTTVEGGDRCDSQASWRSCFRSSRLAKGNFFDGTGDRLVLGDEERGYPGPPRRGRDRPPACLAGGDLGQVGDHGPRGVRKTRRPRRSAARHRRRHAAAAEGGHLSSARLHEFVGFNSAKPTPNCSRTRTGRRSRSWPRTRGGQDKTTWTVWRRARLLG